MAPGRLPPTALACGLVLAVSLHGVAAAPVATGTGGDVDAPALESLTNRQVGVPVSLGDLAALVPHHPNQEES